MGASNKVLASGALDICHSTSHASYRACHHTQVAKGINFLEAEELGVGQPKRCDTCKHCVRCSYRVEHMTKVKAAELAMIEQNVTVDPAEKCVRIRYPTKGDLSQFKDNQGQAVGCAVSLEKRLTRNNTRDI